MKILTTLSFLIFTTGISTAQIEGFTKEGKQILLYENGTWKYKDEVNKNNKEFKEQITVVNEFLTQIYDRTTSVNNNNLTSDYQAIYQQFSQYLFKDWTLKAQKYKDSEIIVEAIGYSENIFGPAKKVMKFILIFENEKWKIRNSYGLLVIKLNFKIEERDLKFTWDMRKFDIYKDIEKNVSLEVIQESHNPYSSSSDSKKGKIKIINKSKYSVKSLDIVIEHFDGNGTHVNSDKETIFDVIKPNGYREKEWYISDCGNCLKQTYKLDLIDIKK